LLRAIILFKLEQLSILTVCFSGTTVSVSYQRASLRVKPGGMHAMFMSPTRSVVPDSSLSVATDRWLQ